MEPFTLTDTWRTVPQLWPSIQQPSLVAVARRRPIPESVACPKNLVLATQGTIAAIDERWRSGRYPCGSRALFISYSFPDTGTMEHNFDLGVEPTAQFVRQSSKFTIGDQLRKSARMLPERVALSELDRE